MLSFFKFFLYLDSFTMLKILDTGVNSAETNMKIDEELLDQATTSILHFYEWEKRSVTYGYFIKPEKFLDLEEIKKLDIDLARRPTGGGIVFHVWDLAFSLIVTKDHFSFSFNTLEKYNFVNSVILDILRIFFKKEMGLKRDFLKVSEDLRSFCMACPTEYDITLGGRKVVGASQRCKKNGYLHQGSISLVTPETSVLNKVLKDRQITDSILQNSYPLLGEIKQGFQNIKRGIRSFIGHHLALRF